METSHISLQIHKISATKHETGNTFEKIKNQKSKTDLIFQTDITAPSWSRWTPQ